MKNCNVKITDIFFEGELFLLTLPRYQDTNNEIYATPKPKQNSMLVHIRQYFLPLVCDLQIRIYSNLI